jgi:hypothetical protein
MPAAKTRLPHASAAQLPRRDMIASLISGHHARL